MRIITLALALLIALCGISSDALAKSKRKVDGQSATMQNTNPNEIHVRGYYRRDGTYVRPHYRTKQNATCKDNFSSIGNVNPHTGQAGTRSCAG